MEFLVARYSTDMFTSYVILAHHLWKIIFDHALVLSKIFPMNFGYLVIISSLLSAYQLTFRLHTWPLVCILAEGHHQS